MKIQINNVEHCFDQPQTLSSILDAVGVDGQIGTAVALNMSVIPKVKWAEIEVCDNDKITVIKATKGG